MPGAMGLCQVMTGASYVQQQEFPLPRADHLHEGLEFAALDAGIEADELGAQHLGQGGIGFQL
ncbi:hypothetical protein D3C87_2109840 [compost metagenome]